MMCQISHLGTTASELVLRGGSVQKGTGPARWRVMTWERRRLSTFSFLLRWDFFLFTPIFLSSLSGPICFQSPSFILKCCSFSYLSTLLSLFLLEIEPRASHKLKNPLSTPLPKVLSSTMREMGSPRRWLFWYL